MYIRIGQAQRTFSYLWLGGSDVLGPDPRRQLSMFRQDWLGIFAVDLHALGGVKYIFEVGPRNSRRINYEAWCHLDKDGTLARCRNTQSCICCSNRRAGPDDNKDNGG